MTDKVLQCLKGAAGFLFAAIVFMIKEEEQTRIESNESKKITFIDCDFDEIVKDLKNG